MEPLLMLLVSFPNGHSSVLLTQRSVRGKKDGCWRCSNRTVSCSEESCGYCRCLEQRGCRARRKSQCSGYCCCSCSSQRRREEGWCQRLNQIFLKCKFRLRWWWEKQRRKQNIKWLFNTIFSPFTRFKKCF